MANEVADEELAEELLDDEEVLLCKFCCWLTSWDVDWLFELFDGVVVDKLTAKNRKFKNMPNVYSSQKRMINICHHKKREISKFCAEIQFTVFYWLFILHKIYTFDAGIKWVILLEKLNFKKLMLKNVWVQKIKLIQTSVLGALLLTWLMRSCLWWRNHWLLLIIHAYHWLVVVIERISLTHTIRHSILKQKLQFNNT